MRQCSCIVCGEPIIRGLRWMHVNCARGEGYDLMRPYKDWPEWAKWLLKNERTARAHSPCQVELVSLDAMMEQVGDDD